MARLARREVLDDDEGHPRPGHAAEECLQCFETTCGSAHAHDRESRRGLATLGRKSIDLPLRTVAVDRRRGLSCQCRLAVSCRRGLVRLTLLDRGELLLRLRVGSVRRSTIRLIA